MLWINLLGLFLKTKGERAGRENCVRMSVCIGMDWWMRCVDGWLHEMLGTQNKGGISYAKSSKQASSETNFLSSSITLFDMNP